MGYTLHCTKKFLLRLKAPVSTEQSPPTTRLGNWYANVLFWKPHVAFFINELTLLPVLVPYAPSTTLHERFLVELERVLVAHNIPQQIIADELAKMQIVNFAPTANRRVMGHLNDFTFQAESYTSNTFVSNSLLEVSLKIANTPCSYLKDLGYNPSSAVQIIMTRSLN